MIWAGGTAPRFYPRFSPGIFDDISREIHIFGKNLIAMDKDPGQKFKVKHNSPLLDYLYEIFPQQSKKGVKACLYDERVVLNGKLVTAYDQPLWEGDNLLILPKGVAMARQVGKEAKEGLGQAGVKILYEDEYLLVVDKASGIPVVSQRRQQIVPDLGKRMDKGEKASVGAHEGELSVYGMLSSYVKEVGRAKSQAAKGPKEYHPWRVWVVHRLDRDTSGLLVFAKDEKTKEALQGSWDTSVYKRGYMAILEGAPEPRSGKIVSYLKENEKSFMVTSSRTDNGGKKSITNYKVIKTNGRYSLTAFELETGRKNQIRVHASSELGCPVAGDSKYGARTNPLRRLALHAGRLSFRHPFTGEVMDFTSPLPKAFSAISFDANERG